MAWKCARDSSGAPGGPPRTVYANSSAHNAAFLPNVISNTKYTWWNFVPKNLWEQFARNTNRYFLLIALLQLNPQITPVNPLTTWAPLAVIFMITAVKEGLDDWGRRAQDKLANARLYVAVRGGTRVQIASSEILVGDIIFLKEDEEIPCDMCILSSSDPAGNCFIQTTNLDGESNLKVRTARESTRELASDHTLREFRGSVTCAAPNDELYKFDSQLRLDPSDPACPVESLSSDQLLLQATHVRNTEFVFGLVVYTGNETKFGNNKRMPGVKLTATDKLIDRYSIMIFLFQLVITIIFGAVGDSLLRGDMTSKWYLRYKVDAPLPPVEWLFIPLRFLLLNSTMIPISLKVTLDLCKLYYAKFINWDEALYDPVTAQPAHSNSTALSEDLGQIAFVLSDKTGTLTENIMVLKVAAVKDSQFGWCPGDEGEEVVSADGIMEDARLRALVAAEKSAGVHGPGGLEFMRCMALNSTVVPSLSADGGGGGGGDFDIPKYKASSPDEEALVKAAASYGVILMKREGAALTMVVCGEVERFEVLLELEFNADRKRMSVVVRDSSSGRIRLYTKGADDQIFARLARGQDLSPTQKLVDKFAAKGLRTLVMGFRDLTEEEYGGYRAQYDAANASMEARDERKEEVYTQMESGLVLIGATAIEDKLQDAVPETISKLVEAGIKFWMLTGDKFSTALTIANTCRLRPGGAELLEVDGEGATEVSTKVRELIERHLPGQSSRGAVGGAPSQAAAGREVEMTTRGGGGGGASSEPKPYTVIIRGATLKVALASCRDDLRLLCMGAVSCVCCRVTPKQKAELVHLVKETGAMTLAVGDGGNDVSMIQEAHIGVGIRGKEGLQAARAADYQVGYFRALQRLLLVHGRYSYHRTSLVAQYSFYKSFVFCFTQIGFGFVSGFAGASMYNSLSVAAYNAVLFVPIVFFCLDRDVSQETALRAPVSYRVTRNGLLFTHVTMLRWLLRAAFHAAWILIVGLVYTFASRCEAYETMGLVLFNAYMFLQDFTMLFELTTATARNYAAIFGMHAFAVGVGVLANKSTAMGGFIDYNSFSVALSDASAWVATLLICVGGLVPVQAVRMHNMFFSDGPVQHFRRIDSTRTLHDIVEDAPTAAAPPCAVVPAAVAVASQFVKNPISGTKCGCVCVLACGRAVDRAVAVALRRHPGAAAAADGSGRTGASSSSSTKPIIRKKATPGRLDSDERLGSSPATVSTGDEGDDAGARLTRQSSGARGRGRGRARGGRSGSVESDSERRKGASPLAPSE